MLGICRRWNYTEQSGLVFIIRCLKDWQHGEKTGQRISSCGGEKKETAQPGKQGIETEYGHKKSWFLLPVCSSTSQGLKDKVGWLWWRLRHITAGFNFSNIAMSYCRLRCYSCSRTANTLATTLILKWCGLIKQIKQKDTQTQIQNLIQ